MRRLRKCKAPTYRSSCRRTAVLLTVVNAFEQFGIIFQLRPVSWSTRVLSPVLDSPICLASRLTSFSRGHHCRIAPAGMSRLRVLFTCCPCSFLLITCSSYLLLVTLKAQAASRLHPHANTIAYLSITPCIVRWLYDTLNDVQSIKPHNKVSTTSQFGTVCYIV